MFCWTRTYYAALNELLFNFEAKLDRDYFVSNSNGLAQNVLAKDAYALQHYMLQDFIRVESSQKLGENNHRKLAIRKWKNENK